MGQAKVRKKNGTYPTPAQMAARIEADRRWNTKVWYPSGADLPLTHVPEDKKPGLRKRLDPWLRNLTHADALQPEYCKPRRIGVRGGCCWEVAQALIATAKDPGVVLVEGVWTRRWELEEGDHAPAPHTWCKVDGWRVDLIGEFYAWRSGDDDWIYEPLTEYTYEQVLKIFGCGPDDDGISPEGFDISSYLWEQNGGWESLPEHLTKDIEYTKLLNGLYGTPEERAAFEKQIDDRNEYENSDVFKPAADRLIKKFKAANPTGALVCPVGVVSPAAQHVQSAAAGAASRSET